MIEIKNLSKSFGNNNVLKDISLSIEEGMITGLAGPSGSGKSTLLRCIQGDIESQDTGDISYNGQCGFMFQDFQLFPNMNIISNLVYAPKINKLPFNHMRKAENLLSMLGIGSKKYSMPHTLSGGQKQRAALAVALMMEPKVLLCDEPTSGLDIATIDDVIDLLKNIASSMNITMIITSHDLDFLTKIADRVIVLKNGTIVSDINVANIANPITVLKEFYDVNK